MERDNRALLEKMTHIMRTSGRVDNHNDYKHKRWVGGWGRGVVHQLILASPLTLLPSLNKSKRQQELDRIAQDNEAILKRIASRQPHYDRHAWERDFDRSVQLKTQITRYPTAPTAARADKAHKTADGSAQSAPAPTFEADLSADDEVAPVVAAAVEAVSA